jgi:hypothetical protein
MLIALGAIKHQVIYDQLYSWKLIPRPERLTELYFADGNKLPRSYSPGKPVTISFVTHNLEYQRTDYSYAITQESADGKTAISLIKGDFSLGHDHTRSIKNVVTPADMGQRSRIVVAVTYKGIAFGHDEPTQQKQSIYYWVTKQGAES